MTEHLYVYLDTLELAAVRLGLSEGDESLANALQDLTDEANDLLSLAPTSVLDKTGLAASKDPHDFFAIGGYSWPNPSSPDGLPYQYRDSQTNPGAISSDEFDKGRYEEMTRRVAVLALAYFYTSDSRYSEHAAALLRKWFIDPETRMNPNFRYAAARPGVWDGHFSGVIEGVYLIEMLDFVGLLEESAAWTPSDDAGLRSWFRDLSDWLAHSSFGRREIYSTNNHGSYLLAQVIAFATYANQPRRARRAVSLAQSQLRRQIKPDGSMPREIDRADGWFYSVYGLRAFTVIARMAERYGVNMWKDNDGIIAQACASLAPYLTGDVEWPFSRDKKPWEHDAVQLFHLAARAYGSAHLAAAADAIVRQSDSAQPNLLLLGINRARVSSGDFPLPAARPWRHPVNVKRDPGAVVEHFSSRVFGVLASRGAWPGRRLP